MEIIVPAKQVPDLVEELEIDASGQALDRQWLKLTINEFDEHALEEALVLREKHGGRVTVLALDTGDVDEMLFTCLAKGADRAVKIAGSFEGGVESHRAAKILEGALGSIPYDLILMGVQAPDDRDGQIGPLLASSLGLPHVSVVSGVEPVAGGRAVAVKQEYAGGVMAELEVDLPALLGIQAAQQAPRYAPVSKVRQAMKAAKIEEIPAPDVEARAGSMIRRLYKPEAAGRAEMLEGSPEEVVDKLMAMLTEKGFVKG
ncbi:MAG: electron transfer flavoprotein subunit beta/FixA family protein [Candidatus Methylomirabilia bacterium]